MGGCITPEIMWSQIDPYHFARLVNHHPSGIAGDGENTLLGLNSHILDIFPQSVYDFLRDENNLGFLAAFWVGNSDFSVLFINWPDFEHLTDPHPTFGHQVQHDPVASIGRSENDFINKFYLINIAILQGLIC